MTPPTQTPLRKRIDETRPDTFASGIDSIFDAIDPHTFGETASDAFRIELAKQDPTYLAEVIIRQTEPGIEPSTHDMHRLMQWFLEACWTERKDCQITGPPEHGKTAQIQAFLMRRFDEDENLSVGYISADLDLPKKKIVDIRKWLLSKARKKLFPQLVPDSVLSSSGHGEWSKARLYFKGCSRPAYEVFPFLGAGEGHRMDIPWTDDCITRACRTSKAKRDEANDSLFMTWSKRKKKNGMWINTSNCWHREDATHRMRDNPAHSSLWIWYEGVTLCWKVYNPPKCWNAPTEGVMPLWESVWPESRLINEMDSLGPLYRSLFGGKATLPEDCRFGLAQSWARWSERDYNHDSTRFYAHLDPSGGKRASKGDFGVCWVVGADTVTRKKMAMHVWCARANPREQVESLFKAHEWLVENYGQGLTDARIEALDKDHEWVHDTIEAVREKRRQAGLFFELSIGLIAPREIKEGRIERLGHPIEMGSLQFPEDLEALMKQHGAAGAHWREAVQQIEEWPAHDHDDSPDSLSGAQDMAQARLAGPSRAAVVIGQRSVERGQIAAML